MSLIKDIEFLLKLHGYTLMVLCSIFLKPVILHEDNQGLIAIAVSPQIQPCTKHIVIKYHQFQSFVANGDVEIQHIDTKEQITDILPSR